MSDTTALLKTHPQHRNGDDQQRLAEESVQELRACITSNLN